MSSTPDILLRIRDNIRDLPPGAKYEDEPIVRSGINPTLRELEASALASTATGQLVSVQGQTSYSLPSTIRTAFLIEGVFYGASKIPLRWREHNQNAAYFAGDALPQWWSQWGSTGKIEICPASAVSGELIFIEAYCSPRYATPTSIVDELQLSLDVEDALISGASWRMAIIDSEFAKADRFLQQYKDRIRLLREKLAPDRGDLAVIEDGSGYDERYLNI